LCQIFGALFALTYSFLYARTYQKTGNKEDLTILPGTLAQHGFFILFIIFAAFFVIVVMPYNDAKEIIGFGADGGSIFMYIGPMAAVRAVLNEKDASSLPLPYAVMCFLNGFCWFAYGWFVLRDIILWGPSIIGLILSSIQISLIAYYGRKDERLEDNVELKAMKGDIKLSKSDHGESDDEETTTSDDTEYRGDLEELLPSSDKK